MSIQKKITYLIVTLVLVPSILILYVSTNVFNRQVETMEKNYLAVAMKFVRSTMFERKAETQKTAKVLGGTELFKKALRDHDEKIIEEELKKMAAVIPYLDVAFVVDADNKLLASIHRETKYEDNSFFKEAAARSLADKEVHFSEEVLPINMLFTKNSPQHDKLLVKIRDYKQGYDDYLSKALIGVNIIPVFNAPQSEEVIGAVVLGDAINNDREIPDYYSEHIKNSFLAYSIDGIRISASIATPFSNDYIGTPTPIQSDVTSVENNLYFGRQRVVDEIHVFLDEDIVNSKGEIVAKVGVGIPEEKFSAIVSDNFKVVIGIAVVCLVTMIIVGRKLAEKISNPIVAVTNAAREYGGLELDEEAYPPKSRHDESSVLMITFTELVKKLNAKEYERQRFMDQLVHEHDKQKELSEELQRANERLEFIVAGRTQHLQDAIVELKKVDAAKSNFMANISHELRTPLNVILGSAEMLKEKIWGNMTVKQESYVNSIHGSGTHLLQLIDDILDISKIATGKMQLNLGTFYIDEILQRTVAEIATYAREKELHINVSVQPDDFIMNADQQKLKQILYNILSNSAKFTEAHGRIDILVKQKASYIEVNVRDTGIGIAEADLGRVWVEFEQVDSSYGRNYEGTGLGLPLVKKLVELHGGEVHLRSQFGIGTEVTFTMPLDTEAFLNSDHMK